MFNFIIMELGDQIILFFIAFIVLFLIVYLCFNLQEADEEEIDY